MLMLARKLPEAITFLYEAGVRITSYNVCYTKLLRGWDAPTDISPPPYAGKTQGRAFAALGAQPLWTSPSRRRSYPGATCSRRGGPEARRHRKRRPDYRPRPRVITSYSIHYTKLYERRQQPDANRRHDAGQANPADRRPDDSRGRREQPGRRRPGGVRPAFV